MAHLCLALLQRIQRDMTSRTLAIPAVPMEFKNGTRLMSVTAPGNGTHHSSSLASAPCFHSDLQACSSSVWCLVEVVNERRNVLIQAASSSVLPHPISNPLGPVPHPIVPGSALRKQHASVDPLVDKEILRIVSFSPTASCK